MQTYDVVVDFGKKLSYTGMPDLHDEEHALAGEMYQKILTKFYKDK